MSRHTKPPKKLPKRHTLTPRQARFVEEYLIDLSQRRAALRAGYARKHVDSWASALMRHPPVKEAVLAGIASRAVRAELTAEMVKERLRLIGFQDIRELYDGAGNLRDIDTLTDDVAPMVAGVEVIIKNAKAGDGVVDEIHKVKVVDPMKALELLAKHTGLVVDHVKLDVHGRLQLVDERAPDADLIKRAEELLAKAKRTKTAA